MKELLNFAWFGSTFRYDTSVFVERLDTAIELYSLYRKLDPHGSGNLWVGTLEGGFDELWTNEFEETLREMFENAAKEAD